MADDHSKDPTERAVHPGDDLEKPLVATALDYVTCRVWSESEIPQTVGAAPTLLKPLTAGRFGSK